MTKELHIRQATSMDVGTILSLHQCAMEFVGAYKGDGPWDNDLKEIFSHYQNNDGTFLVGEINGKIVTMGAIRKIDFVTAEVKRMRTFPEHQGKGFGKLILKELISFAKIHQYKELILETSEKQIYAMNLYQNTGFTEFKKEVIDGFNCTWYKLVLD